MATMLFRPVAARRSLSVLQNHKRLFGAMTQKNYTKYDPTTVVTLPSYDVQFIGGVWTPSLASTTASSTIDVMDSNTGQKVAKVPRGTQEDTLQAIAAAKASLPLWKEVPLTRRLELMRTFLAKFDAKKQNVVERLTVELGCTQNFAQQVQFGSFGGHVKTLLELLEAGDFEWEYAAGKCTVVKEPVGVVGAITPWNYPLNQIALKIIPALLAGCTVVLKPSEVTPLVAYSVAEAFEEAMQDVGNDDIPDGIFNMVVGYGPECGEILASHPDVDLVSFTGSTRAGQMLTEVAAKSGTMKPVSTELGGKSAAVLLDDADYASVVPAFVKQLTANTGQSCNALSRMLVPRKDYDTVLDIAKQTFEEERVGTANDPQATMGPLVSKQQYDRVQSYLQKGIDEGARVVVGGPGLPENSSLPPGGYFVQPTLFSDVSNDMTIARDEIFGPVLSVIPYDTEDEAIGIANDTVYGLNNAVASQDVSRALKVASKLQSGMVMVNGTLLDSHAPFGGYKKSGNAREWGKLGLETFLVTKTINLPLKDYRAAIAKVSG